MLLKLSSDAIKWLYFRVKLCKKGIKRAIDLEDLAVKTKGIVVSVVVLGIIGIIFVGYQLTVAFKPSLDFEGRYTGTMTVVSFLDKDKGVSIVSPLSTLPVVVEVDEQSRTYGHMKLKLEGIPKGYGVYPVHFDSGVIRVDESGGSGELNSSTNNLMVLEGSLRLEDTHVQIEGLLVIERTGDVEDFWAD